MSDVVDRVSDHDDAEAARKGRVAAKNNIVFETLFKAPGDRVSKYNGRNSQDFGDAVSISKGPFSSREYSLRIQKRTHPLSSLTLNFPNDDGAMQVTLSAKTGEFSVHIKLDIVKDTPTYYFDCKGHTAESLADLLLLPVLSSAEFLDAGRKIGFV